MCPQLGTDKHERDVPMTDERQTTDERITVRTGSLSECGRDDIVPTCESEAESPMSTPPDSTWGVVHIYMSPKGHNVVTIG